MKITQSPLPEATLLRKEFQRIDYFDSFRADFTSSKEFSPEDFFKAFFTSSPKWLEHLLTLRNKLVRVFGLKAPGKEAKEKVMEFKAEPGNGIGLFKVMAKNEKEIIVGEDDKHLNFRVSFYLDPATVEGSQTFIFSTTVYFTHWSGKVYFFFVKPFHKVIVPVMAKRMIKKVLQS